MSARPNARKFLAEFRGRNHILAGLTFNQWLSALEEYGNLAASSEKEKFDNHTKAVSDFLNELYAIMVDPLAEGTIKVAEMMTALRAAALLQREQLHAGGGTVSQVPSDPRNQFLRE